MTTPPPTDAIDRECMTRAIAAASRVRCITSPNPWVGAVVRTSRGDMFEGATQEPGQDHAEVVALRGAGPAAAGATLYVTLEPCSHTGRTGPCTDAIIAAGVARVVVGIDDPDPLVSGTGIAALRDAGIEVTLGVQTDKVRAQLAPYLKHRTTGRPWVVLKLAATLDGGTAAPNGSSQWITSPPARVDGHRLRAESDAILVGAGTVRRDDPSLTVRDYQPPVAPLQRSIDPERIVLGKVDDAAKVQPCRQMGGDLGAVLDESGLRRHRPAARRGWRGDRGRLPSGGPRRPLRHLRRAGTVRRRRRQRPVRGRRGLGHRRCLARPVRRGRAGR